MARLSHGSSLLVALITLATQCKSAFSVAALTRDGVIRVWESALCDVCSSVAAHEADTAVWACSSPCGTFIATGTSDGLLKLLRVSRVVVNEAESSNLELAHKLEVSLHGECECRTRDSSASFFFLVGSHTAHNMRLLHRRWHASGHWRCRCRGASLVDL